MGEFEEQWAEFAGIPLLGHDGCALHHEAAFSSYDDVFRLAPLHQDGGPQALPQEEQSETAAEHVSDTFEFFDLANAAFDFNSLESPARVAHVTSPIPLMTQYSLWPQHIALEGTRDLDPSNVMIVAPDLLRGSQMQDKLVAGTYPAATALPVHCDDAPNQPPGISKRAFQEESTGEYNLDSRATSGPSKKRKKRTQGQLDGLRKVREQGACLRCYVHRQQCSAGRPCKPCLDLFMKNHNSKTLQWTECVSASLPHLNIFAIGVAIFENEQKGNRSCSQRSLDFKTVLPLHNILLAYGIFSGITDGLDDLYDKVLWHTYCRRATEIHPFILEENNPMYMLVQLNVILLGSPIIAPELIGRVQYLQKLRAICAVVAFEYLGRALDRNWAKSSLIRQGALIIQIALLLEQVMEMRSDIPAAALSCARGNVFEEMRRHLIQYLLCYLRKLVPGFSGNDSPLSSCIQQDKQQGHLREDFWDILSSIMPCIPLRKPPMLRKYQDMSWGACGIEEGKALQEHFSATCSIECN